LSNVHVINARAIGVRGAHDMVRIIWEVDGSSGATDCQAWRCQYELDKLQAAGYHIVRLECA
jgi:hypothetical protein